jgi:hypothetical protein
MLLRETGEPLLERESGTGGTKRVVRLMASAVEERQDAVTDELFDLAAEAPRDQRRGDAPIRVEDGRNLGRRRPLRERRESNEVAEQDANVFLSFLRRRQVEMPETPVAPFPPSRP